MLNAINQYKLDTHLGDYPEGSFIPISQETYNFFESFYGIKRQFKDEVFYYPENNIFIGRESPNSLARVQGDVDENNHFTSLGNCGRRFLCHGKRD